MTKIHSPAGLFFLSPVKKCIGVSGNLKIQMRILAKDFLITIGPKMNNYFPEVP